MKPVEQLTDDEFAQHVHQALHALPDAPVAWQQAAQGLWQTRAERVIASVTAPVVPVASSAAPAAPPGWEDVAMALRRLVTAALTFDSWATSSLAHGMRALRAPTRYLLYSAQGRDIDLRISPLAEHFALSGQILGPDESGHIELSSDAASDATVYRASIDALGEFRLEGVPAGLYMLTLHVGQGPDAASIVVQAIEVGEAAA